MSIINESCKKCSTIGCCPFSFNEESEKVQNYGCLPTPIDIIEMRVKHGRTWACHSNKNKPCLGAINYLKKNNLPFKVINKEFITENMDWSTFIKK